MRFAHVKRIIRPDRLRLRGLGGVGDEVPLTAQNPRRLAKLLCRAPATSWSSLPRVDARQKIARGTLKMGPAKSHN
jgi:hypothetical protein